MKKFTLILAATLATYMVQAQAKPQTEKKDAPATKDAPVTQQPAAVVQPQPKDIVKYVEFKNAEYDFGKIPFGKPSEYEVTIKNISKEEIVLENIQVGCGCTTPKYEAGKKIPAGDTYKVTLGFNGSSQGQFTKFATLKFNDGMQKQVTFKGETYTTPDNSAPANEAAGKMKTGGN